MGVSVYDAAWYDVAMTETGAPAMEPLETSPWLTVYTELSRWIDRNEEVVDLGAGTGRFAELLRRRGHYGPLTLVDWSQAALDQALEYIGRDDVIVICQDLAVWQPSPDRSGNTVYVCSEVLEHLEDDLALVRAVPPGHRLLFTVPNFDSESHLRVFRGVGDLWARYGHLVDFRRWVMVGSDRQGIHVCETRRRGTAW